MPTSSNRPEDAAPVAIRTADRLRVAANATRMRLFKTLSWRGPSRTSDLAEELGLPHNSVSYHLRELERAGYISKTEGDDKRESWWTLTSPSGISFEMTDELRGPALDIVRLDHQITAEMIAQSEEINRDGEWPTLSSGFGASLTRAEVEEVYRRLKDAVEDIYQRGDRAEKEGQSVYFLAVNFFPIRLPD